MSVGYIYILSNSHMPGLLKTGFTNRDVKQRVGELSSATGVPKPFEIEYYCLTRDPEEIERKAHERLLSQRAGRRKEFFEVPLLEAVKPIDSFIKPVEPDRYCRVNEQALKPQPPTEAEALRQWQEARWNSKDTL